MFSISDETFLGSDFGLGSGQAAEVARELMRDVIGPLRAEKGYTDAHTHFDAKQILDNEPYPDIFTAMVLDPSISNRDHYIIQLLAGEGVPFEFMYSEKITPKQKWMEMARHFPDLPPNQVHTWMQLELRDTLGIDGLLSLETAERIWSEANRKLKQDQYTPQGLLRRADLRILCTTDDPIDDLSYHARARKELDWIQIFPTFRPDKAIHIGAAGWKEYIARLADKANTQPDLQGVKDALAETLDFFITMGCRASDHGLEAPYGRQVDVKRAEEIFRKAYSGTKPTADEEADFESHMIDFLFGLYQKKNILAQEHFGAYRNVNPYLAHHHGPDTGGDTALQHISIAKNASYVLGKYCSTGDRDKDLKVVLYAMSQNHFAEIAQLLRVFPGTYYGRAWWMNDSWQGMVDQFRITAPIVPFSRCAGMVCDGRKLLSVEQRHRLADRVVAFTIANLVAQGLMPYSQAPAITRGLCYEYQASLFNFPTRKAA